MQSRIDIVTYEPNEWIDQHEPDWEERRCLSRAIVTSSDEHSVTEGAFTVSRCGDKFTIDGPQSRLILHDSSGLDKIMAGIAWVDAIEEYFKRATSQSQNNEPIVSIEKLVTEHAAKKVEYLIADDLRKGTQDSS
jgi:hypothetical protein